MTWPFIALGYCKRTSRRGDRGQFESFGESGAVEGFCKVSFPALRHERKSAHAFVDRIECRDGDSFFVYDLPIHFDRQSVGPYCLESDGLHTEWKQVSAFGGKIDAGV